MRNIGKFDRLIDIVKLTQERGLTGGVVETYAPIFTVWAEIIDLTGREFIEAETIVAKANFEFNVRFSSELSELNTKDRIVFDGGFYKIISIILMPRGRPVEIKILTENRTDGFPSPS